MKKNNTEKKTPWWMSWKNLGILVGLVASGLGLLASMFGNLGCPIDLAWISIIICGIPIVWEAGEGLIMRRDIKAGVLVSMALIASIIIGEEFAAGEVAFIMQLGEILEHLTVSKARAGIERLVQLTPRTARVVSGGREHIIAADAVKVGDLLRVLPGETIPVDGIICSGQTSIDQSIMTGESMPEDKGKDDEVYSGTVNQYGAFDMKATRVGEDSSLQRMIRLVKSANTNKNKIVRLADRWATWIVAIALVSAILTWVISGEIIRAVTILVVFCPCALVLATPTAIMAAIGNAAKHGFLVREGDALERLAPVTHIIFDKTGTLTCGTPRVKAVKSIIPGVSDAQLLQLAAQAESRSEHPLGKAISSHNSQSATVNQESTDKFDTYPGLGVQAILDGKYILVGNADLFQSKGIVIPQSLAMDIRNHRATGSTIVFIGIDQQMAGYIVLSDVLRDDAPSAMSQLQQRLKLTPMLLTGDHQHTASHIAGLIGIQHVHADCTPEDKLRVIDHVQQEAGRVCMIGDGINDAPALKKADVGIAMGGIGSDIAADAADIVLINDALIELPHLMQLAQKMMKTIRWNIVAAMALNFAAILLAMTGILTPVIGALVHNAGSVVVIAHSAFLLKWQPRPSKLN